MRNDETNARISDWLLNPTESLDWEAKSWLDLSDLEHQGTLAKELIALENHGGGFLVIGFMENSEKRLVEDLVSRPTSLDAYSVDAVNAIVRGRAEPAFHVEVTLHAHPNSGTLFPLIRVPGESKVPVRSRSETPNKSLRNNTYYIRAPGPESRAPMHALEWDVLIRRAILNQREDIVATIRHFVFPDGLIASEKRRTDDEALSSFVDESISDWSTLNDSLPDTANSKVRLGFMVFAARVVGALRGTPLAKIQVAVDSARRFTGWPPFVSLHNTKEVAPGRSGMFLQAWLGAEHLTDVGHVDFWRIDAQGRFFLLRGYQEDAERFGNHTLKKGKLLDVSLPVWRVGEFILRALEIADSIVENPTQILLECRWTGLRGRKLFDHRGLRYLEERLASDDIAVGKGTFPTDGIRELLPEVVRELTQPLYETFELFVPPTQLFSAELSNMTARTY